MTQIAHRAKPATNRGRSAFIWGLLLVVALSIIYGLTLQVGINGSSNIYAEDVGEFQNVLTQWGTPHPTGYPLYSLTGAAFTSILRWLGVSPAAAASSFSLVVMMLALIGVYVVALRLAVRAPVAAGAALLLGVIFPFWYHASVAEVYALLIGLLVLTLLIALQWRADRQPRHLYELAFVFGLAFGHHRLAILIVPTLLILIGPTMWLNLRQRPARFLGATLCLVAAFSIYLYLPLRAWLGGTWIYGQPGTWSGFWSIVLAREYGALVKPAVDLGQTEAGLGQVVSSLADNLTWPLLLAGIAGLLMALRSNRRRWFGLALLALLATNIAFAGLFSRAVFMAAALMPAVLALGLGVGLLAQWLAERGRLGSIVTVGALTLATVFLMYNNGPAIFVMTHDPGGQAIIDRVRAAQIDQTTERPVIMALWGRDHFALAYARNVTRELAGIEMVDHRADVKAIVAGGQTLYVLSPTFYLRPLDWWTARLGRAYLSSYGGDLVRVSDRPVLDATTVSEQRAVMMAPDMRLRDWQVTPLATGQWQVTLYWQATSKPSRDYSVTVKASDRAVIDSPDAIVAQDDRIAPVYGWYPTTLWSAGEIVRDDHLISPPPERPAETVTVGLYVQDAAGNFQNFGKQVIVLQR